MRSPTWHPEGVRRLYALLPGPPLVRLIILVALVLVILVGLGLLFEAVGDLLDTGGTIGP